jgi:hypothetical protein
MPLEFEGLENKTLHNVCGKTINNGFYNHQMANMKKTDGDTHYEA